LHLARVQGSFVIKMPPYYDEFERWLDQPKWHMVDARHRLLLHNDFGVDLCEELFGNSFYVGNTERVALGELARSHVEEYFRRGSLRQ
jgi:hypothetical protein